MLDKETALKAVEFADAKFRNWSKTDLSVG